MFLLSRIGPGEYQNRMQNNVNMNSPLNFKIWLSLIEQRTQTEVPK